MRIKKVSETTPIQAQVVDSLDGNSTTDAPSVHAVKQLNTYSTTEQKIGTWTDGKPLYRKVLELTTTSGTNSFSRNTYLPNSKKITKISGNTTQSDGTFSPLSYYNAANDYCNYFVNNNNIYIRCGSYGYGSVKMIVEYTKTTD